MDAPPDRQLARLEERIGQLEQLVVRTAAGLSALLLVLGVLLDYISPDSGGVPAGEENDPDVAIWGNLLTLPFKVFGFRDGPRAGEDVLFGICYLGLLLVVAAALYVLYAVARGDVPARLGRVADVVGWLLVLGTLGALPVAIGARSEDTEGGMGPAVLVLAAGVALYLLSTRGLRQWWNPMRGAGRR
jgi:hypothetical protein